MMSSDIVQLLFFLKKKKVIFLFLAVLKPKVETNTFRHLITHHITDTEENLSTLGSSIAMLLAPSRLHPIETSVSC